MKKVFAILLLVLIVLLSGCNGDSNDGQSADNSLSITERAEIASQIEAIMENGQPQGIHNVLADKWLTVNVDSERNVSVSIRVIFPYVLPYAAEQFLPLAIKASEESETTLKELNIRCYSENSAGIIDGTMVNWRTTNLESGTFSSEPDGNTIITNATIDMLKEYYSEYATLVQDLVSDTAEEGTNG